MTSIRRNGFYTLGFSMIALACNFLTGVIGARALHPDGRGALTAIVASPGVAAWAFGMGAMEANSYGRATNPSDGPSLLSTWLLLLVPLGLFATGVLEFTLPIFLGAQSTHVLFLGRIWAPTVIVAILVQILNGTLLGAHDYLAYSLSRYIPSLIMAVLYLTFYLLGVFTVETALVATITASLLNIFVVSAWLAKKHHGLGTPSWRIAHSTFLYGLRAHGSNLGTMVNTRLDLLIMPAFLAAASVGLYSVGTNVSSIVIVIAGSLSPLVLAASAGRTGRDGSHRVVMSGLTGTLVVAISLVAMISVSAGPLLAAIYGRAFLPSVTVLRLLLPGSIMLACAQVFWSGLNGLGRPGLSAITQVPAVVITVGGLLIFLKPYGIDAAAIVSSAAYTACFLTAGAAYLRVAELSWTEASRHCLDYARSMTRVISTTVRLTKARLPDQVR